MDEQLRLKLIAFDQQYKPRKKTWKDAAEGYAYLVGILVVIGVLVGGALLPTYLEMKTFNKFSSVKASFADALFGNLRVTPQ